MKETTFDSVNNAQKEKAHKIILLFQKKGLIEPYT